MPRLASLLALCLLTAACGEEKEIREWTPEDHAHPPEAEVDPSRVPGGAGGAGGEPQGSSTERAAAALWLVSCASCHGREGRGDGPGKPPEAQMVDLTDPAWQASKSDEEIAEVIAGGRGLMPRFDDRINPRGIAALVGHVRRLNPEYVPEEAPEGEAEQAPPEGQPAPPTPEGQAAQPPQGAPEGQPAQPAPEGQAAQPPQGAPEGQAAQPAQPAPPQAPTPQPAQRRPAPEGQPAQPTTPPAE